MDSGYHFLFCLSFHLLVAKHRKWPLANHSLFLPAKSSSKWRCKQKWAEGSEPTDNSLFEAWGQVSVAQEFPNSRSIIYISESLNAATLVTGVAASRCREYWLHRTMDYWGEWERLGWTVHTLGLMVTVETATKTSCKDLKVEVHYSQSSACIFVH